MLVVYLKGGTEIRIPNLDALVAQRGDAYLGQSAEVFILRGRDQEDFGRVLQSEVAGYSHQ
jgi:hypothetical protein